MIWDEWQATLQPLREQLNKTLGTKWEEWEITRDLSAVIPAKPAPDPDPGAGIQKAGQDWTPASAGVTKEIEKVHADWWQARIARQKEIDASIAAKAEVYLYDKPYDNRKIVRVAGPFTVKSLSPHRVLGVDENDEVIDPHKVTDGASNYLPGQSFERIIPLRNPFAPGAGTPPPELGYLT